MLSLLFVVGFSAVARRPVIEKAPLPNGLGCDVCKALVKKIEEALLDQKTEEEIAKIVSNQCSIFGEQLAPICKKISTTYVPIIMQFIENKLESLKICQILGFCETDSIVFIPHGYMDATTHCDTCKKVVGYIETLLKNGLVEKEIAAAVALLCKEIPFPGSTLCGFIVNKYIPVIIRYIEQGIEKFSICDKIGFCATRQLVAQPNGITCTLCTTVVSTVETVMKDTQVEAEVAKLVSKVCTTFPAPYSTLCTSLVSQYVPMIMEWLEQGLEKADICAKLGLCERTLLGARIPAGQDALVSCDTCKSFVTWAESELESVSVPALWKLVNEKCPSVPYLKYFCAVINEDNIRYIVSAILSAARPQKVCELIRVC